MTAEKDRVTIVNLTPILNAIAALPDDTDITSLLNAIAALPDDADITTITDAIAANATALEILEEHVHTAQKIAPWGSAPVTLTSGAGAYTWGNYSEIIAASAVALIFDLHWAVLSGASANADYEIEFVYGASNTLAARVAFSRSNAFTASITLPLITPRIAANSKIQARMRDSTGSSTVNVKVMYHEYD